EDGIRDKLVTGVQTCALPISGWTSVEPLGYGAAPPTRNWSAAAWYWRRRAACWPMACDSESGTEKPFSASLRAGSIASVSEIVQIGRASCRERVLGAEVVGRL